MNKPFFISFIGESRIDDIEQMIDLEDRIYRTLFQILEYKEFAYLMMTNYDDSVFDMVAFTAADWLKITEERTNFNICLVTENPFENRTNLGTPYFMFDKLLTLKKSYSNNYITREKSMVDVADLIISYVNNSSDKVVEVFDYAIKQNKKIINFGNR